MTLDTIARWHELVRSRNAAGLGDILADDAVFHSPVVHTPQAGKAMVQRYLAAAFVILGGGQFRYVREVVGARDAALEFVVELDGITVNGVDLITWGEDGRITDFKVMLRPLKAVNLVHQKMAALLPSSTA